MWFLSILISAFLLALRRILEKRLSDKMSFFTLGWAIQFFCLPLAVILLFFTPVPNPLHLSFLRFWIPLLIIWIALYPIQTHYFYKSIHEAELSLVLPLLSLIPVLNTLISFILLRELPSPLGFTGIFCILIGIFILNKKASTPLNAYFKELMEHKASIYMIITSVSIAVGSTLDKIAIKASNPYFYNFANTLGAGISLFIIASVQRQNHFRAVMKYSKELLLIGTIFSFSYLGYLIAVSSGLVSYVVAIRSTNLIIASLIGILFLGESKERKKFISFAIILVGLLCIGLG
jgi:drug/metabolite transporter (DMT)-like permease